MKEVVPRISFIKKKNDINTLLGIYASSHINLLFPTKDMTPSEMATWCSQYVLMKHLTLIISHNYLCILPGYLNFGNILKRVGIWPNVSLAQI